MRVMADAERVVRDLFAHYTATPADLPAEWGEGIGRYGYSRARPPHRRLYCRDDRPIRAHRTREIFQGDAGAADEDANKSKPWATENLPSARSGCVPGNWRLCSLRGRMTASLQHDILRTEDGRCLMWQWTPTREVDLLIAGAGPAGMTAALVASLEGLDVLLCEKSDQVGGTGSTSAGTLWIPGNSQSRAAGFSDSGEQADRYLNALIGEARPTANLRNAYLQTGPTAIDYLCARTDVQFLALRKAPGLSQQHAGRRRRRPRHRAEAVRRPTARRGIPAHSPAGAGVHGVRRHDGRQGRHSTADRPVPVRSPISFIPQSYSRVISPTA